MSVLGPLWHVHHQGITLFQKVGSTNFRFAWKFGGINRAPKARIEAPKALRGVGCQVGRGAPSPEKFSLLTLEKAHFGGYLMHFDILILTLCFAVHRMLQGCVTDSVSSPTCCSSCGGLAPDKLCPCLCPFSSTRFPSPPILFLPFSFLTKLTRCSYTAACSL